jgi:hypothetical protein
MPATTCDSNVVPPARAPVRACPTKVGVGVNPETCFEQAEVEDALVAPGRRLAAIKQPAATLRAQPSRCWGSLGARQPPFCGAAVAHKDGAPACDGLPARTKNEDPVPSLPSQNPSCRNH